MKNHKTAMYELNELIEYGVIDRHYPDRDKTRRILSRLTETGIETEKKQILDAFLFGFQCGGKSDAPEQLAELYYDITYGEKK